MSKPARMRQLPDGTWMVDPPPTSWWARAGFVLVAVALVLLTVQITVTTYRTIFPRVQPPTQYYVCVYLSAQTGVTTVSGPQPCPRP